jgi:hypothetical protein
MMKAILLASCLLLGCQNECEKIGKDKSCVVVGSHIVTDFIWIDNNAYPMTNVVNDYSCVCMDRVAK